MEVDRIVFEAGHAVAVLGQGASGPVRIEVAGEVILCAGAIASPSILQRSGVGPGAVLQAAAVPVLAESPRLGCGMRDHLGFSVVYRLNGADPGNNHRFRGLGLAMSLLRYGLTRSGPLATGPYEVGAFVRSRPGLSRPDLQLYAGAFSFARNQDPNFPVQLSKVEDLPGMTLYGQMLQLESEGSVAISSSDMKAPPVLTPNWLQTQGDQQAAIAMVRTIRRLAAQPALAPMLGEELVPGPLAQDDAAVLDVARRLSRAGTHATSSCAMGLEGAPLDADGRVRGVDGVRVVDCSSMPGLVSGNTNVPAMAFAWAMADRMGCWR